MRRLAWTCCGVLVGATAVAGCAADFDGAEGMGARTMATQSLGTRPYRPVIPAREFDAGAYRGEVVVLDFWATWCGPCVGALPAVQRLHQEFRGRPVRVLGVSTWERPPGEPLRVMMGRGCTYGLVTGGDSLARDYGVGSIPTMVVIGVDGAVIYREAGGIDGVAPVIERHLAEHGL